MNIVMIADRFFPHVGGVERHLWEVSSVLLQRGHVVSIITDRYDATLPEQETVSISGHTLSIRRVSKKVITKRYGNYWQSLFKLGSMIREADVVHIHDFSVFIQWYFPLRFLLPSKPVYVTFHGWEGVFPLPAKVIILRRIVEKLSWGNICIGDFICKWYGTKADYISYGGTTKAAARDMGDTRSAVFLGRLAPDTGIMMYLEALRLLRDMGFSVPLTVCGDGPLRPLCESFVEQHDLPVEFTGFVENTGDFLAGCSFAFVSGYLSILEALSMGKMVFSVYDNPLKKDYLCLIPDSKEIMYIAGGSDEVAEQLVHCLQDRERCNAKAERAVQWASKQTWDAVTDIYEKLWGLREHIPD